MSSLSSGLNSCCSVITVDWVDRFRKVKLQEGEHVRLARKISWLVGGLVVALTYFAGIVPGNLLEMTNKLVNLLTSPLFVLFFMALFVPWATSFGACLGTAASIAVAVGIAHFKLLDLGFLWMGPVSLAVGILVGSLASLPRIGPRRPMLARAAEPDSAGRSN
jgi:SSS family solute:Na+ symporter